MEKRSKPADFSDLAKKARDSRARRQLLYRHGVPDEAEQVLFKPYFDEEEDTMADVRGKDVSFLADRKSAVDYLRTNCLRHGNNGFGLYIPHMAVTIFDRFCLKRQIPLVVEDSNENLILFLKCCLKISWYFKRDEEKLEFPLLPHRFPRECEEQMENEIYKEVKDLVPVQPFDYTLFFSNFLTQLLLPQTFVEDLDLLLARYQDDVESTSTRPSVVAAVGMLVMISKRLPNQLEHFSSVAMKSKSFEPLEGMIETCQGKMELLYDTLFDTQGKERGTSNTDAEIHELQETVVAAAHAPEIHPWNLRHRVANLLNLAIDNQAEDERTPC